MTRAVFFDFYNTLARYDPPAEKLQVDVLREFGHAVDLPVMQRALALADHYFYEENRRFSFARRSQKEQEEILFRHEEMALEKAGLSLEQPTIKKIYARLWAMSKTAGFALFDDSLPALAALRQRGLILGMISNIPPDRLPALDRLGLTRAVDFVVIPQDAGADKPDPAIFHAALKRAAVSGPEAVHVGDQYYIDAAGAMNAGLRAILLDRYDLFSQYTTCPRITSLLQVPDHI